MDELDDIRYIDITLPNGQQFTLTLDNAHINNDTRTLEAVCRYRVVAKSAWRPEELNE